MTSAEEDVKEGQTRRPMLQAPSPHISLRIRLHGALGLTNQAPGFSIKPTAQNHETTRAIASSLRMISWAGKKSDQKTEPSETKASVELSNSFHQNMKRVSTAYSLENGHAPKLISSLNRVPSPLRLNSTGKPYSISANLDLAYHIPLKGHLGSDRSPTKDSQPLSAKQFLFKLPKRVSNQMDKCLGADTARPQQPPIKTQPEPHSPNNCAVLTKTDDDILETFSRNAQYKTSKRRMTKMVKIPMIVTENSEDASDTDKEESKKSHESGYSFSDKRHELKASLQEDRGKEHKEVKNERRESVDLAVQYKDLLNQSITRKVVINTNQPKRHRPSIDLGNLVQNRNWMPIGHQGDRTAQSSKSILAKPKFQPKSSQAITTASSNQKITPDHWTSSKKKVVFAKNKMVLLFEKDP